MWHVKGSVNMINIGLVAIFIGVGVYYTTTRLLKSLNKLSFPSRKLQLESYTKQIQSFRFQVVGCCGLVLVQSWAIGIGTLVMGNSPF